MCVVLAVAGCSSEQAPGAPGSDGGILIGCGTDAAGCLSGTVTSKSFTPALAGAQIELHRVFPGGLAAPLAVQPAGASGTWAFGNLDPWEHYYVRVVGTFDLQSGVVRIVGPLTVPSDGGSLVVDLRPVAVSILESRPAGGPLQLVSAMARVFDPATGVEIVDGGATVAIEVGDASVALPWNGVTSGTPEYGLQPSPPLPAQPSYTIAVSTGADAGASQWTVIADPPLFDGRILSLGAGGQADAAIDATVVAQQPLAPTWAPPPATSGPSSADYVLVELFEREAGAYAQQYQSPSPESPDTTHENIGGAFLPDPATYLLNVAYARAHCDLAAVGCVHASTVAAQLFDASAPIPRDAGGD
jgi:hypothetical protein